ncbi:hypothetical protein TIFTF001_008056 [Ficus carica]|uniref:Uncharacterized protein n=1 Tax=Ficus carica TaxID=3494 RepID=A0AA88AEE5_FICCA|nr:hypothetical protein TIFTF001_008056 [Ficus carica]
MIREVCDGHFMAGKSLGFACFHGKRDEKYVSPQHVYLWPYCPLLTPVLTKDRNLLDHVLPGVGGGGRRGLRPGYRQGRDGGVAGAGEWGAAAGWGAAGAGAGGGGGGDGGGSPASGLGCRRRSPAAGRSPVMEKTLDGKGNMK